MIKSIIIIAFCLLVTVSGVGSTGAPVLRVGLMSDLYSVDEALALIDAGCVYVVDDKVGACVPNAHAYNASFWYQIVRAEKQQCYNLLRIPVERAYRLALENGPPLDPYQRFRYELKMFPVKWLTLDKFVPFYCFLSLLCRSVGHITSSLPFRFGESFVSVLSSFVAPVLCALNDLYSFYGYKRFCDAPHLIVLCATIFAFQFLSCISEYWSIFLPPEPYQLIVAPIFETILAHICGPVFTIFIALLENAQMNLMLSGALFVSLWKYFIHASFIVVPLHYGILLHLVWNFMAVLVKPDLSNGYYFFEFPFMILIYLWLFVQVYSSDRVSLQSLNLSSTRGDSNWAKFSKHSSTSGVAQGDLAALFRAFGFYGQTGPDLFTSMFPIVESLDGIDVGQHSSYVKGYIVESMTYGTISLCNDQPCDDPDQCDTFCPFSEQFIEGKGNHHTGTTMRQAKYRFVMFDMLSLSKSEPAISHVWGEDGDVPISFPHNYHSEASESCGELSLDRIRRRAICDIIVYLRQKYHLKLQSTDKLAMLASVLLDVWLLCVNMSRCYSEKFHFVAGEEPDIASPFCRKKASDSVTAMLMIVQFFSARFRDALVIFDHSLHIRPTLRPFELGWGKSWFVSDVDSHFPPAVAGFIRLNQPLYADRSIPLPPLRAVIDLLTSTSSVALPYVLNYMQLEHGLFIEEGQNCDLTTHNNRWQAIINNREAARTSRENIILGLLAGFCSTFKGFFDHVCELLNAFPSLPEHTRLQSVGDLSSLGNVLAALGGLVNGNKFMKVADIMVVLIAFVVMLLSSPFNISFSAMKETMAEFQIPNLDEKVSLVTRLSTGLKWIHDVGVGLYTNKLQSLFGCDISRWLDEANPFACYQHSISHRNFNPSDGSPEGLSCHDIYAIVDSLLSRGAMCLASAQSYHRDQEKPVSIALSRLSALRLRVDAFLKSNTAKAAPFSVLFSGDSAIAKTKLVNDTCQILQMHANLPRDPCYTYIMPPENNFFDGFVTSHHTVVLDDVGAIRPGSGKEDRTVSSILQLVNNTPFSPESAKAEDKGNLAWVGKLVIASTNDKRMNVGAYYSTPNAVYRRMPIVVNVQPLRPAGCSLDMGPMTSFGTYEAWRFVVEEVELHRAVTSSAAETTVKYNQILVTESFVDLMQLLTDKYDAHMVQQDAYLFSASAISNMGKCLQCNRPAIVCRCATILPSAAPVPDQPAGTGEIEEEVALHCSDTILSTCSSWSIFATFIFVIRTWLFQLFGRASQSVAGEVRRVKIAVSAIVVLAMLAYLISTLGLLSPLVAVQSEDASEAPPVNVWVRDRTAAPLSAESRCVANDVCAVNMYKHVSKSLISVSVHYALESGVRGVSRTHACSLGGPLGGCLLINAHALGLGPHCVSGARRIFDRIEYTYASAQSVAGEIALVTREVPIGSNDIISFPDTDLCVVVCRGVHFPAGIYKYLLLTPSSCSPRSSALVSISDIDNDICPAKYVSSSKHQWHYSFSGTPTKEGDCGRPLLGTFDSGCAVLGIHTAGSEGVHAHGEATPVTRLCLDRFLKRYQEVITADVALQSGLPIIRGQNDLDLVLGPGNEHTGTNRKYGHFPSVDFLGVVGELSSYSSSLVRPLFYDFFSKFFVGVEQKIPPNLNPRDREVGWIPKHRLLSNINCSANMDQAILDRCVVKLSKWMVDKIESSESRLPNNSMEYRRVLTEHEAINGIPHIDGFEGLDMKTGFGFPENVPKVDMFTTSVDADGRTIYSLKSRERIEQCVNMMSKGIAYTPIFRASRKDEPISASKLKQRGPRLIFAANTIYTILIKRYFGSLVRLLFRSRHDVGIAVGMNATSVEWHHLFIRLSGFSSNCLAGDFGNFDQRLPPRVTKASVYVLMELNARLVAMNPFDRYISRMLMLPLTNFLLYVDRDLFSIVGPNPSGQALTTQTNCISVILILMYVWVSVGYDLDEFFDAVCFTTYGDDHILMVKDGYESFSYDGIGKVITCFGMEYTTFDKSTVAGKSYDCLTSVEFLKRGFIDKGGICVAQLNRDSIIRRLYIGRKYQQSEIMCCSVDVLSSIWNDSLLHTDMAELRSQIRIWLYENDIPFDSGKFPSWDEYAARYNASSAAWCDYYRTTLFLLH